MGPEVKKLASAPVSTVYGPVPSRRLGFSLGIDLFPRKTCSFDCVQVNSRLPNAQMLAELAHKL